MQSSKFSFRVINSSLEKRNDVKVLKKVFQIFAIVYDCILKDLNKKIAILIPSSKIFISISFAENFPSRISLHRRCEMRSDNVCSTVFEFSFFKNSIIAFFSSNPSNEKSDNLCN